MIKSGCMKIQISGKEPEVLSFIDFDFTAALENNPNASVEYLMVLSFLYKFFPSRINYDSPLPNFGTSSFYSEFSIGTSYSKDNLEGYSDLNPTLACFSESSLKESLVLQLGLGKEALSLTIPQLEVLLKQSLGSSATIYRSPVNLKVLKCSASDLAAADTDGVSVSPMEDVFNYLTPRLSNTTPRLGKEYTVAEYTTGSSEITFNSDYAVGLEGLQDEPLDNFDYAVIRYRWTPQSGLDLDTRTLIKTPNRSGNVVGWNKLGSDEGYLTWNGDNTSDGVESVLLDIKKILQDYPNQQNIVVEMRAFWYSERLSGDVDIEFSTFSGGTMEKSGFDFINVGGVEGQSLTVNTNSSDENNDGEGQPLAVFIYNPNSKSGSLTKL